MFNLLIIYINTLVCFAFVNIFTLLGSVFDYKNRTYGNLLYDLPSSLGFIFGCIVSIIYMIYTNILVINLIHMILISLFFYKPNNYYIIFYMFCDLIYLNL